MLGNLKLNRPLAFIDVETTGVNPHVDRVVELSILRIQPDGIEEYKSHRVNPEVPIPSEATAYRWQIAYPFIKVTKSCGLNQASGTERLPYGTHYLTWLHAITDTVYLRHLIR